MTVRSGPSRSSETSTYLGSLAMTIAGFTMISRVLTGRRCGTLGRANARSDESDSLSAVTRLRISLRTCTSWLSAGRRLTMTWMAPEMPASGFLTSWAITAAICPSWAIVSFWRSSVSTRLRSVMSVRIARY